MTPRAVICDLYGTLLEVAAPPADAPGRWRTLCQTRLPGLELPALEQFDAATHREIDRALETRRAAGTAYPEVSWSTIAQAAWPALKQMSPDELNDFLFEHAQLQRTIHLMAGAAEILRALAARKILLGIASNSQPYTLRELDAALGRANLTRTLFDPALCFFSFEHGFSKPDPKAFRLLLQRLAERGVLAADTLMIGDREDNDIIPARAQGFRTWQLVAEPSQPAPDAGSWKDLKTALSV